ncbi:MAG TPA: hypothetical protein VIR45_02000 [Kiloniellaceae bacterium]
MYLWRNLPDGQLLAVLRWMQARRESPRPVAPVAKPTESGAGFADAESPASGPR